jgi:hypothetical protein
MACGCGNNAPKEVSPPRTVRTTTAPLLALEEEKKDSEKDKETPQIRMTRSIKFM